MAVALGEGEQPRRMSCHLSCLDSKLAKISSNKLRCASKVLRCSDMVWQRIDESDVCCCEAQYCLELLLFKYCKSSWYFLKRVDLCSVRLLYLARVLVLHKPSCSDFLNSAEGFSHL